MRDGKSTGSGFSASKRDFLKKMVLVGVYVGPVIKTFEMAEISGGTTGPVKKVTSSGQVRLPRSPESADLA